MQPTPAGTSGRPLLGAPPRPRRASIVRAQGERRRKRGREEAGRRTRAAGPATTNDHASTRSLSHLLSPFLSPGPADGPADLDVAVFRFTLGIPGIDDSLVPRIVGALGAAGLAANHIFGGAAASGAAPAAQARAEALGGFLAAACMATPSVEARLKEAAPGRGRGAAASLAGAASVFAVAGAGGGRGGGGGGGGSAPADAPAAPAVADAAATPPPPLAAELAWASYALLRNTNAAAVVVARRRGAGGGWEGLLARGGLPPPTAAAPGGPLAGVGAAVDSLVSGDATVMALLSGGGGASPPPLWLPDREALGGPAWAGLAAPGAACALLCPLPPPSSPGGVGGVLILLGDRPRGLTPRDRAWAGAVAAKLGGAVAAGV